MEQQGKKISACTDRWAAMKDAGAEISPEEISPEKEE